MTRAELLAKWEEGWAALFAALADLTDAIWSATVIDSRVTGLQVLDALHRSLAHTSYHVGQIVFVAKAFRGTDWTSLSIPPGQSDAYNRASDGSSNRRGHAVSPDPLKR